jgi:hypothetical protein
MNPKSHPPTLLQQTSPKQTHLNYPKILYHLQNQKQPPLHPPVITDDPQDLTSGRRLRSSRSATPAKSYKETSDEETEAEGKRKVRGKGKGKGQKRAADSDWEDAGQGKGEGKKVVKRRGTRTGGRRG